MKKFAVLAEDRSDAMTLVVLVKRIMETPNAPVEKKGFGGCGELRQKAASFILDFASKGATHFILCHDSDGNAPDAVKTQARDALKSKIDLKNYHHEIIVPVQELEAWIIADEEAVAKTIPSLKIGNVSQPERLDSPKEWLIKKSRRGRSRPLYAPATWNEKVAVHLDISKVENKCNSFRELTAFIRAAE